MSVPAVLNALFLIPDLLVQPNDVPGFSSSSTANGLASAFNQLATDLKSDNFSAARKAYATVQPSSSFSWLAHFLRFSEFSGATFLPARPDLHSGDLSKA